MKSKVTVHEHGTTIVLGCGKVVHGFPQGTEHQAQVARDLGYGDDDLQMVKDHDALHALLCDWLGIGDSFALRLAVGEPVDPDIARVEEAAVLAVQKFMRLGNGKLPMEKE